MTLTPHQSLNPYSNEERCDCEGVHFSLVRLSASRAPSCVSVPDAV
uniref:Uncharacterized protein n=1 Tax=Anguilla anguilla TaxID=7936 RepID=A0A0E9WF35_ANGAN